MGLNKKVLVSLFIAAIMILSTIGFVANYSASSETLKYKEFKFVRTPQGLRTKIDGTFYYFNFFPAQVEDITVEKEGKKLLKDLRAVSVSYAPNSTFVSTMAEVQLYFEETLNPRDIFVVKGLTDSKGYQLPEITCLNATEKVPVIEFREANATKIAYANNCFVSETYSAQEFLRITDRILYLMLGVMD